MKNLICDLVDRIFREFAARCRNWQRDMPDQAAVNYQKKLYVELLLRSGIREAEVIREAARKVCEEVRWYQLPDDFVALCQTIAADRLGLPAEAEAYRQAIGSNTEKHPAVVYTLRQIGQFEFRRMTVAEASSTFAGEWKKTIAHVLAGGELPTPVVEIEHRPARASRDTAAAAMGSLKGLLA